MVFSVKENKNKIIAIMVLVGVVLCAIIFLPKMTSTKENLSGETNEQRVEFLNSFGWEVDEVALDSRDVTIPVQFSEVYTTYNRMQKSQDFDLTPYSGKICTQYIYKVNNYPINDKEIHATMLVFEGKIIGGDISCAEVDGFMHGFASDSEYYGGNAPIENNLTTQTDAGLNENIEVYSTEEISQEQIDNEATDSEIVTDKSGEPIE